MLWHALKHFKREYTFRFNSRNRERSPDDHGAEHDFKSGHRLVQRRHVSVHLVRADHGLGGRPPEGGELEEDADGGEQVELRLEEG
jgi:hypothetical protein